MKFEPTNKFISGFNSTSLAAVVVFICIFMLIGLQLGKNNSAQKVPEKVDAGNNQTVVSQKSIPVDSSKTVKEKPVEVTETPDIRNSIIEKSDVGENELKFELSFEGRAIRRIRNYLLPENDGSMTKEKSIKLNFTIRPDGSVGKVYPVTKTNSKLELISMNSLREWRFEPLKKSADQVEQQAVITFLR